MRRNFVRIMEDSDADEFAAIHEQQLAIHEEASFAVRYARLRTDFARYIA